MLRSTDRFPRSRRSPFPLLAALAVPLMVGACTRPDVEPTLEIRSPAQDATLAGFANIGAVFSVEDDSDEPVEVTYVLDEGDPVTVTGENCSRGCSVTAQIPTEDLDNGLHTITASVTDINGNEVSVDTPVEFAVHDIPYVSSIAVLDTQEGGLNGPNMEVEVHLLDDDTAEWLGCAPLEEVQQDDVQYDGLVVPFIRNEAGERVLFEDIGLEIVRVVVIESDNNEHCPIWPALTEELESDVDDLYGISPPLDLSLLFSGPVDVAVPNTTGLRLERGRPLNTE